ncbi:nitroreductase family protein [Paenibacillus sp. DMB20]|uniref:nitroreductase family protein n=1 Tax=Paenibacillus sp. DMB20 TaxID=1642570 RepID=UPI0006278B2A|nr:nitroreductase [Paenibacillus sp. DMB20]KKO54339.1 nitroreductase [Paenibacillus sp. DMB20]
MDTTVLPIAKVIQERRTIKKFKPDPVAEGLLLELLNTAAWAPNHGMREPWRFTLFVDEGKQLLVKAISDNARKPKDPARLLSVPAYIAVMIQEDERQREFEEDMLAAGTFVQNFQLAAWERGVGVKWLTEPFTYKPEFRASIGVQPREKLVGLLQVGYPEEVPAGRPRTPVEEKLTIIRDFSQQ